MTYKLTQTSSIYRLADNTSIPADPQNRDYVEYLKWVEAGNTPQPAGDPYYVDLQASPT